MKAIHISLPGGPEVLQLTEREKPKAKADQVLIKIKAAGINRPDVLQRKGGYPAPKDAPADIPGLEVAGVIEEVGENVTSFKPGDRVCALISGGGYAEYTVAPSLQCLPIPHKLSFEEAASLPETFFTVWNNIFDIGQFKPGETVLVHGGSSGIGVAAIQMVKAMGGNIIVTAGNTAKCQTCEKLGADLAINYREEDFESGVNSHTAGKGVDIVLDMIGGNYTEKNVRILKSKGRLVMINAMNGKRGTIDLLRVMSNQLVVTGSTLRPRPEAYKGSIAKNLLQHVWPLIPSQIQPVIYQTFPLAEAEAAHRLMESSEHIGKIILTF